MKYWQCNRGHLTYAELKPDVCRKCKEVLTDLWLSNFKEITGIRPMTDWEREVTDKFIDSMFK